MASSPETAPSRGNPPPDSSNSTPPPPTPAPPDNNSTPPPASVTPPPAASSPPPPTPTPSPPQQPPPASTPPPSTPSTTPSPPTAVPPPPAQSQPPPANNTPTTPAVPPPPSTPNTPPAPATAQPPPAAPGSPPAPVVSPTPPGVVPSQTPPSVPGLSPPGLVPPGSGSANRTPTSVTPPPSSSSSNGGGGISTGIIVAIAFGGVVIIAVLVVCLIFSKRKKKPQYYMGHGPPPKGGDQYYNGPPQWNSPQPMEHMVKIPPPPGTMGTPGGGGGGGWGPQPPAHMANTSNSDNSPGYTSGQHPMMQPMQQPLSPNMGGIGSSQSQFSYEDLAAATNGFSQANLLGQGGFGYVHKGVLLDKREVAVKSLKTGSGQGEREFQAEVEIISRVHHRHLVSLVGYCIASDQRMLVYEFVPNKTLEFHLHGKGQPVMDWSSRLRIALGSAKGLAYLHEDCHPRIIHRDIKAANILLDSNFEAMVADFGLAKLTTDNFTHVSTRVMGTFGYLAPEYAASGKLTEKSDVFSFGVMLLELITGRRPVDPTNRTMEDSLVDWARPLMTKALEDGNYEALVDPRLEDNYVPHEMARMVASASATIRHSARRRPKMSQIVRALEGAASLEDLNDNVKSTTKSATSSISTNTATEVYDTRAYDADIMKFRQMVLTNQDTNSSEYGATSEYGLNPSSSSSDSSGEIGKKNPVKQKM